MEAGLFPELLLEGLSGMVDDTEPKREGKFSRIGDKALGSNETLDGEGCGTPSKPRPAI